MADAFPVSEPARAASFAAAGDGPLLLALSGGGDSTALLHGLAGRGPLIACVVDHGVRAEAAAESALVANRARALGVAARVVRLSGLGAAPSQAALRRGRYGALIDVAREAGARAIALAHTLDDQAETLMLRAQANTGWRGLAGMRALAPAPLWPDGRGIVLTRPLLRARRAALRAWLTARGAAWIEDSSNDNARFARVRIRRLLQGLEAQGFDLARFGAIADRIGAALDEETHAARAWLAGAVNEAGALSLTWTPAPEAVRARALSAALIAASGAQRAPSAEAVVRLARAIEGGGFRGRTLHGCRIAESRGRIVLTRDPGAIAGRGGGPAQPALTLAQGQAAVWDGRLAVRCGSETIVLRPDPAGRGAPLVETQAGVLSLPEARAAGALEAEWLIAARLSDILFTPP